MIVANDNCRPKRRLTPEMVLEHVAFEFDLDIAGIVSASRQRRPTWARYATAWLACRHSRATRIEIGRVLGGRDKWKVGTAIRQAKALRDRDEYFQSLVDRIEQLLLVAA